MNKLLLLPLILLSMLVDAQASKISEARDTTNKAYAAAFEKFKGDPRIKELGDKILPLNQKIAEKNKAGGLVGGIDSKTRASVVKKLNSDPDHKKLMAQRNALEDERRKLLMELDPNYKVAQEALTKILPKINARLPKTTTTIESYPGRFVFAEHKPDFEESTTLWYTYPATSWLEAVPLGNGSFGCVDFGGLTKDVIQFNHDTLWSPPSLDPAEFQDSYPNKEKEIDQIRQLIFSGNPHEAHEVVAEKIQRKYDVGSYQPFAELHFDYDFGKELKKDDVKKYCRSLNMETGVSITYFEIDGTKYERQTFVVNDRDVIGIRMRAIGGAKFSTKIHLFRPSHFDHQKPKTESCGRNSISISGKAHGDVESKYSTSYESVAQVSVTDGSSKSEGGVITVENTSDMTVWLSGATNYNVKNSFEPLAKDLRKDCFQLLSDVSARGWDHAFKGAVKAHNDIFGRVAIRLGEKQKNDMPVDLRVRRSRDLPEGEYDHYLTGQLFQMGRYLLIASSRPGSMMVNLRGIWNSDLQPTWNSDYHHDINIEMSYWSAEVTNMSECHIPLFESLKTLKPRGARVAKEMFGSRGVFVPLCHGGYLTAYPPMPPRSMWGMAGPWDATHVMEHYRFGQDKEYLKSEGYQIIKDHVLWSLDWLVVDPRNGKLVAGPDYSPETAFALTEGDKKNRRWGHEDMGCALSQQIVWQLFTDFLEASEVLGISDEIVAEVKAKRAQLAPTRIGADGTIMEWSGDYISSEPDHRHSSHMWAIYPGSQFNVDNAPDMMKAGEKTLAVRTDSKRGGKIVTWSNVYYIYFYARFGMPDKALYWVNNLNKIKGFNMNLMGSQGLVNDANYGYPGAVSEMLLQSHTGEIKLLPALPKAWDQGEISGIVARGGFEISMKWANGKLLDATILSKVGNPCSVRYGGTTVSLNLKQGDSMNLKQALGL